MSLAAAERPFPRGALIAGVAMIVVALAAAVAGRLAGAEAAGGVQDVIATRDLRFEDRQDGGVAVLDPAGRPVAVMPPGTNGFLRATLRGLARERRREDLGAETPFRLTAWAAGGITLEDLSTGRQVHLQAFGPANAEVFARLLAAPEATP